MKYPTEDITICDVTFTVEYSASAGRPGTHWEPPEPAELEVLSITINGSKDIAEFLDQWTTDHLYQMLEAKLSEVEEP